MPGGSNGGDNTSTEKKEKPEGREHAPTGDMEEGNGDGSGLLKRIEVAITNLVTLQIVTAVGPPEPLSDRSDGPPGAGQDALKTDQKRMTTTIRLDQGDIVNQIDPAFVTGDFVELRTFHEAQVQKGQQIIRDNIAALKELYGLVREHGIGQE